MLSLEYLLQLKMNDCLGSYTCTAENGAGYPAHDTSILDVQCKLTICRYLGYYFNSDKWLVWYFLGWFSISKWSKMIIWLLLLCVPLQPSGWQLLIVRINHISGHGTEMWYLDAPEVHPLDAVIIMDTKSDKSAYLTCKVDSNPYSKVGEILEMESSWCCSVMCR